MYQSLNHGWRLWSCLLWIISLALPMTPVIPPIPSILRATATPQLGINSHLATRLHFVTSIPVGVATINDSGATWVREDIHWYRIQRTPHATNWDFYDQTFAALAPQHSILGVLGHPPGWATPDATDDPYDYSFAAPDPVLFAQWAAHTVQRYRTQIHYWQIWNEPDSPYFWRPSPDPIAYAKLVHLTARAIAQVAPEAVIVAAGVNPFAPAFLWQAAQAGLWNDVGVIAIHPYVNPLHPDYSGLATAVDMLTPLFARYGRRPVWATEVGWSSGPSDRDAAGIVDANQQAHNLRSGIPLLWQSGIDVVFWYALKDEAHNPYGLIAWGNGSDDFAPKKPAWQAFHTLATAPSALAPSPSPSTPITSFEGNPGVWIRGDEPYGTFVQSRHIVKSGSFAMALDYSFPAGTNRYVVFRHRRLLPLPRHSHSIALWIYGDNSSNRLKLWLKGSDGAIVQLAVAPVGATGWHQIQANLPARFDPWDRIGAGDGILREPITIEAIILDDEPDGWGGSGTLYIDDISTSP
jgi:hypothetical protein